MIIRELKPTEWHTPCEVRGCGLGALGAVEFPKEFRIEFLCCIHMKQLIDSWGVAEAQGETVSSDFSHEG